MNADQIAKAVALIRAADGLLITAGAGMGVDSGLPDFRSNNGFWKTYPALARSGIQFESVASPSTFVRDTSLAWGFYGHRLNLYRKTIPHDGFRLLQEIGATLEHGSFVFTSNVDGHFHKAGFPAERITEIHGSIHHLQCLQEECSTAIWSADDYEPEVDDEACRLLNETPTCRYCGGLARPNILMFGDWSWRQVRARHQQKLLDSWLRDVTRPVVIEIGAGTDIPTIRMFSDRFEHLIRINPREPQVHRETAVGIGKGGLESLIGIGEALGLSETKTGLGDFRKLAAQTIHANPIEEAKYGM
jgi:NAD-dependent SIR2 family protein deacetylase